MRWAAASYCATREGLTFAGLAQAPPRHSAFIVFFESRVVVFLKPRFFR
jgi:hypothetical protein